MRISDWSSYVCSSDLLVNTARCKLADRDAIVRALESGQLAGYAGDVWFTQPAPKDHPWRTMPHEGMTPHISGTSLSAKARYAAGTRAILECYFEGRPIRDEYLIVDGGKLAGTRSEEHTTELQSLMRISYAVFCLKKKKNTDHKHDIIVTTVNSTSVMT